MGPFEYLLLFAAVVLGLAVSEIAINFNRLMSAHAKVRWDWLAPLAALVAFLKIVTQWWTWYRAEPVAGSLTFEMYLVVLVEAVLLFLLSACTLPDHVPAEGLSLRDHYDSVRRRFWLLFAVQWALWNGVSFWIALGIEHAHFNPWQLNFLLLPAVLTVLLIAAFVKNRILQTLILAGFVVLYVLQSFGTTLTR
jgi:hypothetical protein